jgi:osmotically-inducible protein OsmY
MSGHAVVHQQPGVSLKAQVASWRLAVLNALHWDLAVPRDRLKVEVENGWVTMSGMVDRPYQRTCAESDARGVPGVVGVTNQIRFAPAQVEQGIVGR